MLVGLFAIRALSTWLCISGGGVGGLFIPLVTQGAIVGSVFQHVAPASNAQLFPTVGIAAFLGAGYRTPLAGVAFVAEATPSQASSSPPCSPPPPPRSSWAAGLSACSSATSASPTSAHSLASRSVRSCPQPRHHRRKPDPRRRRDDHARPEPPLGPVVDDTAYFGLLAVTDVVNFPRSEWPNIPARDIARTDLLPAAPQDPVSNVAMRLRASDSGAVAVTADGRVIGVVTLRDLTNIEVLLDRLSDDTPP